MLPYPTLDYLADLSRADILLARTLTFTSYTSTAGWDLNATIYGADYPASQHSVYKITLTAGASYDVFSTSYFDPSSARIFDQYGNTLVVNNESDDAPNPVLDGKPYNWDVIADFVAPYTGIYYIDADWNQSLLNNFYELDVFAKIKPATLGHAPVASAVPSSVTWGEGVARTYTLPSTAFSAADGGKLSYYAVQSSGVELPSWLSLDRTTGTFSGTAPNGAGDVQVLVFAKDATGLTSSGTSMTIVTTLGAPASSTTLSTLNTAYTNILRFAPINGDIIFNDLVDRVQNKGLPQDTAIGLIVAAADYSTSVATLSYQFFTGKIPGLGGIDYLVSPTGPNANNLNSAYYQSFNIENRYINFAVNLGKFGDGAAKFAADYGGLTLFDATRAAYKTIFGSTPSDAKIHALIDDRTGYFDAYGHDGVNGQGTKAAMVGWLLAEAVKADVGLYSKANDAFLIDLADGATFAIDLVGAYGKADYNYGG